MTEHPKLPSSELDVLIVGAGLSGIFNLHTTRKVGFSVKILEKGDKLGGVWYWNHYPGARVDTEFRDYQYSIEELWKDWNWSERFPDQGELMRYFEYVDQKLEISKDVLFNTRVVSARFNPNLDRWDVSTDNGLVVRPRFMILCTGICSESYIPLFKGLESFRGIIHHTARWPQEGVDMRDKRVGVIGTGASGVQVIQEAGPICAHLTVFQRTATPCLPMKQYKLDNITQNKLKETYPDMFKKRKSTLGGFYFDAIYDKFLELSKEQRSRVLEELWQKGGMHYWTGGFTDMFTDEAVNDEIYEFWRKKTLARIKDPEIQEILAPKIPPHPFGIKRHPMEQNYYEMFNLPNVTVVHLAHNPVDEITNGGLRTKDGTEHELDIIVLATGFNAYTENISRINIEGTDGITIGEKWKKKVSTYLGLACAGYPNMFLIYGPQAPSALCNGPTCAVSILVFCCRKHSTGCLFPGGSRNVGCKLSHGYAR